MEKTKNQSFAIQIFVKGKRNAEKQFCDTFHVYPVCVHLHNRYSQTPPGVTEWTFSPYRLRAVDIAERDHHCRKKQQDLRNIQHLIDDDLKASLPV